MTGSAESSAGLCRGSAAEKRRICGQALGPQPRVGFGFFLGLPHENHCPGRFRVVAGRDPRRPMPHAGLTVNLVVLTHLTF